MRCAWRARSRRQSAPAWQDAQPRLATSIGSPGSTAHTRRSRAPADDRTAGGRRRASWRCVRGRGTRTVPGSAPGRCVRSAWPTRSSSAMSSAAAATLNGKALVSSVAALSPPKSPKTNENIPERSGCRLRRTPAHGVAPPHATSSGTIASSASDVASACLIGCARSSRSRRRGRGEERRGCDPGRGPEAAARLDRGPARAGRAGPGTRWGRGRERRWPH